MVIDIKTHKLFTNITEKVSAFVKQEADSIDTGVVNIFVPHTTCCLKILEPEILHHVDVRWFLDEVLPKKKPDNRRYAHDLISLREDAPHDERINAFAHMRSLFFETCINIPINSGSMLLGKWQAIFFIELDPVRDRKVICTIIGS